MKAFQTRTFLISAAAVAVLCGLTSCRPTPREGPVSTVAKLTLAAYAGDESFLPFVAQAKGYYAANGLDVTIKRFEAGKLAMDAFLAGEADLATCSEFVFVSQSFRHSDLRVVAAVTLSQVNELVARRDHGISQPIDLKGKTIGVTKKSSGEFFLGTFLTFSGLSTEDVRIVDLTPSQIVEAMVKGEIDATNIWGPNVQAIKERLGEKAISWPGQSGQDLYFVVATSEAWIRSNPATLKRFLSALIQAERHVADHEEEAREMMKAEFGYNDAYISRNWPKHRCVVTLPQGLILAMENQARWRIEQGLTDKTEAPNYLQFIHLNALDELEPEAISIFR